MSAASLVGVVAPVAFGVGGLLSSNFSSGESLGRRPRSFARLYLARRNRINAMIAMIATAPTTIPTMAGVVNLTVLPLEE